MKSPNAEKEKKARLTVKAITGVVSDISEHIDKLLHREIKKSVITTRFEIGCALASKIDFDLRTAEWP